MSIKLKRNSLALACLGLWEPTQRCKEYVVLG
jgi:hypothetical protein